MSDAPVPDPVSELRETLEAIETRLTELQDSCRRATLLLDRLAGEASGAPSRRRTPDDVREASGDELDPRQAALLVAVTSRGGTLEAAALSALAVELGVAAGAVDDLFTGAEPHLVRRGAGANLTERGVEAAAGWMETLPPDLLKAATDL